MKNIPTFENFIFEASKIKIVYTPIDKKVYTTQTKGIEFEIKINGKSAKGIWQKRYSRIADGVDINELQGENGRRFYIFGTGGTQRSYPLRSNIKELDKQPKDLRFTGPYLDISNLKKVFIDKITQAIEKPNPAEGLTKEFLEYFEIQTV